MWPSALKATSAGDADRRRRGGQDATRGRGGDCGLRPTFPDGVWVVELAAVDRSGRGARRGGGGARHHPAAGMTLTDSIAAALEGRSRLLLFDNCEHVLNAAADMVEAILTRSATVTILATSREGLRVADEQLWPVPSLDTDSGSDSAAATLFVERAGASRRTSVWHRRTGCGSWRSADGSTASRWPSSWRLREWCR